MFALLWLAIAAFGVMLVAMGWRVYTDEDWDSGDWWAFSSYAALHGLLFLWLFPTTRGEHTRHAERVNGLAVALWGALLFALGVGLCWYEAAH